MTEIFAQGDLLLERVADVAPRGRIEEICEGVAMVLAEGEATGHRHAIWEHVTMFRDALLARDIPAGLYIGHLQVASAYARVTHDEHAPITLPRGPIASAASASLGHGMRVSSRTERRSRPEQTAAIEPLSRAVDAIRRSTEPADRDAAEEGVRLGLRCRGPGAAGAHRVVRQPACAVRQPRTIPSRADGPQCPMDADRSRCAGRRTSQIGSAARGKQCSPEVEGAVEPADALVAAGWPRRWHARSAATMRRCCAARPRGRAAVVTGVLQEFVGPQGFRHAAAGPGDLSWLATCDVLRRVLGVCAETEPLRRPLHCSRRMWAGCSRMRRPAGFRERPERLRGDVGDRLHMRGRPGAAIRDGWSVWAWRGVEVLARTDRASGRYHAGRDRRRRLMSRSADA